MQRTNLWMPVGKRRLGMNWETGSDTDTPDTPCKTDNQEEPTVPQGELYRNAQRWPKAEGDVRTCEADSLHRAAETNSTL